ncbi:protein kinase [Lentisphaera profundi]|uniref:Protein kinase n=1 Tax=Lentisphaera profundi TaxID=1658616 RepID=A0ABY7VPT3_9BACT|nr:protein kinase [Lentisphaera profundi]WDE96180.1 protein kinase [Lentisphaera profundi]
MKFKLTCDKCDHIMDLEGTIHVDRFTCVNCGSKIELRAGRMEEGVRIAGKYQTLFKINDDGYSSSFICKDLNDDALHILRIYDKTLTKLVSNAKEFMDLIGSVSFLAGENHMPIIDTGISNEYMYQVMPFRKLESIEQLIAHGFVWETEQALDLVYELLKSLEEGFEKIGTGHFNLNPNNIFISNKGKVRYQGFGLAPQLLAEKDFISSDLQVFDIYYMSPELANGTHYPNQASDIYSVAMILYYMMTGLTPRAVHGINNERVSYDDLDFPTAIKNDLDNDFIDIFTQMSVKDSSKRFQTYQELRVALESYYSKIGHSYLPQMEGEKTDLYKSELYLSKVTNLLKSLAAVKLKSIDAANTMSSMTARRKMATQTALDIDLDLSVKMNKSKRVRRRRLAAPLNPKKIHRNKSKHHIAETKSKSKAIYFIMGFVVLAVSLTAVIFSVMPDKKKSEPLLTQENSEIEIDLSVADKSKKENIIQETESVQTFKISKKFYELELRNAEPDFETLDKRLLNDREKALKPEQKLLLEKYAKRIDQGKIDEQRRRIIELKSEAGSLIFNKKYDDAIALYLDYDGPFAEETAELRKDLAREVELKNKQQVLIDQHQEITLEITLENISKIDLDNKAELIAEYLLTDEYLLALMKSKELLELDNTPRIKKFVDMVDRSSKVSLTNLIMTGLASAEDSVIELEFNNKLFKAEVLSCDLDEAKVKLAINLGSGILKRDYLLDDLPSKQLVKWVQAEDEDSRLFLQAMYYVYNNKLLEADQVMSQYRGLFQKELLDEFAKRLSLDANVELEDLFATFNYPYLKKETKDLAPNDLIAFEHLLKTILEKYGERASFNGGNQVFQNLQEQLKSDIPLTKTVQVFVGVDGQTKFKIEDLVSKNNLTIRLLPGEYDKDLNVSGKKINIIGTKNSIIQGNVILEEGSVLLENLIIHGDLIVGEKCSGVNIKNCLIEGAILLREDVDKMKIENSIFHGINGRESKKVEVLNSVILKPLHDLRSVISGIAAWEFVNCIINSNETLINFDRNSKKGEYSYCLLYTSKVLGNKRGENYYSLKEADGEVGDFNKCLFVKPKFKDLKAGDFRLLELSPGYQQGYKKQDIGVKMNEDLDLR